MERVVVAKNREEWLKSLKSDKGTMANPNLSPEQLELDAKIRQKIRTEGSCKQLEGVFWDGKIQGNGWEEEVIRTDEGTFTKIFGCTYLYPGEINKDLIDRVATVKGVWMEDLRFLITLKQLIALILPLILLFQKPIFKALVYRYSRIYLKDLVKWQPKYNKVSREILRVSRIIVSNLDKSWDKETEPTVPYRFWADKLAFNLPTFLQADNAYLSRVQDALWAGKGKIKDTLDILIQRDNRGVGQKFKMLRFLLNFAPLFPELSKAIRIFEEELNLNEIEPTEADIFFSLNREGYNYGGKKIEERRPIWNKINKEKGHVFVG